MKKVIFLSLLMVSLLANFIFLYKQHSSINVQETASIYKNVNRVPAEELLKLGGSMGIRRHIDSEYGVICYTSSSGTNRISCVKL
jgi:hypothetical protein